MLSRKSRGIRHKIGQKNLTHKYESLELYFKGNRLKIQFSPIIRVRLNHGSNRVKRIQTMRLLYVTCEGSKQFYLESL